MANEKGVAPPDTEKAAEVTSMILTHGKDADEAMKAFSGYEGEVLVLDEATNKRLLRKIDLHLMPVILCGPRLTSSAYCHTATLRDIWT